MPTGVEADFKDACQVLLHRSPVIPSDGHVVIGRQGWILLKSELQYLVVRKPWLLDRGELEATPPRGAIDPLSAILYFDRELKKRGITLIVVPVPVRPLVFPESVVDTSEFPDSERVPYLASWQEGYFEYLRSTGCQALDLTPIFIERRLSDRGPVFSRTESHWTGHGLRVAGEAIAAIVKGQDWYGSIGTRAFREEWVTIEQTGDLSARLRGTIDAGDVAPPDLQEPPTGPFAMPVRRITSNGEFDPVSIERRNPESPVVIIGDSYVAFGSDGGFGLGQQLAYELGFAVDVIPTEGGGANAARMNLVRAARTDPGYLATKKCVIWCLTSRDFVGMQWFPTFLP